MLDFSDAEVNLALIHAFIVESGLNCIKAVVVEEKSRTTNRVYER